MNTEQRTALRETYLFTFDAFAVASPTEVVDAEIANNPRHARELLATLTNHGLLAVHDVNGDGDVWQVENPGTYDNATREDAESTIDNWLVQFTTTENVPATPPTKESKMPTAIATATKPTKPAKPTTKVEFKHCLCGCGENVPPKSNFRPGHDARMAGRIGKQFIADGDIDDELLQTLPTEKLRDKAMAMFIKHQDKVASSKTPTPKPEPEAPKATTPKPTPPKRTRKATTPKA